MNAMLADNEAGVWFRAIQPEQGDVPVEAARWMLGLRFAEADRQRAHELCAKAASAELSPSEAEQLDGFRKAGALLEILQSKARRTLKFAGQPA